MTVRKFVAVLAAISLLASCSSSPHTEDASGASAEGDAASTEQVNPELAQEELNLNGTPEANSAPAEQAAPVESAPTDVAQQTAPAEVMQQPAQSEPAPVALQPTSQAVDITNIKYQSAKDGGSVVIEATGVATYRTRESSNQNQVVIEVANARLPSRLKRPFNTKDFKQSVASVQAYQEPGATTARVVIQFREPTNPQVTQEGKRIVITPFASSIASASANIEPSVEAASVETKVEEVEEVPVVEAEPTEETSVEAKVSAGSRPFSKSTLDDMSSGEQRYYGKRISVEVTDTPVRDVLHFIADQSGANLIIAEEIKGNITLKLRQLPWDQALHLIMKAKNLGYARQGSVLRIAPLQALVDEAKAARDALDSSRNAQPLKLRVIPVSYARATDLVGQVGKFKSARGTVEADARTGSLIITDIIENIERITNLVKALDTPPLQVLIEAKIVEAAESFSKSFGINWQMGGATIETGGDLNITPDFRVNTGTIPGAMQFNLAMGTIPVLGDLDIRLGLFEKEDQVKIISSPRVMVLNNETASIDQKTGLPQTTVTQVGNAPQTSTTYLDIPTSLSVTPQITADSDVILNVDIQRQFASGIATGSTSPNINRRQAKTKVLVRNGATAVIGGMFQSDTTTTESGVPFLKDIPVLGWLFKKWDKVSAKNELILFITPRIVNNQSADKSLAKGESL